MSFTAPTTKHLNAFNTGIMDFAVSQQGHVSVFQSVQASGKRGKIKTHGNETTIFHSTTEAQ